MFSSELRPKAWLVLQALVLHCNKGGECFPSTKTIAAKCGYGTSTVKRALDKLMEAGYIIKQARFNERGSGDQISNFYTLYSNVPQSPVPEQPAESALPTSGKEAEKTENVHPPALGFTSGKQSALFFSPAYSFINGFKEGPDGKNAA